MAAPGAPISLRRAGQRSRHGGGWELVGLGLLLAVFLAAGNGVQ